MYYLTNYGVDIILVYIIIDNLDSMRYNERLLPNFRKGVSEQYEI